MAEQEVTAERQSELLLVVAKVVLEAKDVVIQMAVLESAVEEMEVVLHEATLSLELEAGLGRPRPESIVFHHPNRNHFGDRTLEHRTIHQGCRSQSHQKFELPSRQKEVAVERPGCREAFRHRRTDHRHPMSCHDCQCTLERLHEKGCG